MAISGIREQPWPDPPRAESKIVDTSRAAQPESPFLRAVRGLGREIDAGEAHVGNASQLRSYDTASLIALQAGIYRYTEAVDLASKIVERATTSVRTVLQGSGH